MLSWGFTTTVLTATPSSAWKLSFPRDLMLGRYYQNFSYTEPQLVIQAPEVADKLVFQSQFQRKYMTYKATWQIGLRRKFATLPVFWICSVLRTRLTMKLLFAIPQLTMYKLNEVQSF